jgi:hypothetical protein
MSEQPVPEAISSDRDLKLILALIAIVLLFAAGAARAASRRTRTEGEVGPTGTT